MAKKSRKRTVRAFLFRVDTKRAQLIESYLERKGIKQGTFFAEAALEKIAREQAA
jgi:hypothetical protein